MKRFTLTCFCISVFVSAVLFFAYGYLLKVVGYHLLLMAFIISGFVMLIHAIASMVKNTAVRRITLSSLSALFLFSYLTFYLFVLGSNHFWHKTITLNILKNYATSFQDTLSIIPIQEEIIITFFLVYLGGVFLLYRFIRPNEEQLRRDATRLKEVTRHKTTLISIGVAAILLLIFYQPILQFKRIVHMAEEPLLQFTLGAIWGNNNDIAFDKVRYQNGLKDKACTDSIRPLNNQHTTIIILIDGLRADHLPMYGYKRNTAPFLDSLYQQNKLISIKNAFSTSTNTIGGIAGLFFSKDWTEFGFNGLSLMKFFKKSGYKTHAYLTGFHRDWYGLSALYRESCDVYYESTDNPDIQNDDDLVTLKKITQSVIDKKSFVFIHLLSVHMIGKKNEQFKKFLPDKIGFQADKKTALINNYDNGILQSDFVIRNIFSKLTKDNLLDDATVYILSDHGELFGENDSWGHGDNIHENLLTVPVLIYDSQLQWYQNRKIATLKDVAPTIAERVGATTPLCWEGRSLHYEPENFSVEVNSAEVCSLPHGVLSSKDSIIQLDILNTKRQIERRAIKTAVGWQTVNHLE